MKNERVERRRGRENFSSTKVAGDLENIALSVSQVTTNDYGRPVHLQGCGKNRHGDLDDARAS